MAEAPARPGPEEGARRVALGRLLSPYGVRGWIHVGSWTDPPEEVLRYPRWQVAAADGSVAMLELLEGRRHGRGVVVRLAGVADRAAAGRLAGREFWVERGELPELPAGQFYRVDLEGLTAVNLQGRVLGRIDHFIDAPANAVMVVIGEGEHWLPLVRGCIRQVDRSAGRVIVDWDPDF